MNVFAAATGIGSWPGSAPRPAAEVVVGELHRLAHLVELPERGIGADLIGRAAALLVDIGVDTVARGYRIAAGRSTVTRRAVSLLDEDIDALEEAWERAGLRGAGGPVKVQAPGPITLAAQLELSNGHRAITDPGALRDLAASLAEGVAAHRTRMTRRLETPVVVQIDEPSLPAALSGRLTGVTSLAPVPPADEAVTIEVLDDCVDTIGGAVMLHSCAAEVPWKVLRRSKVQALSIDAAGLGPADMDGLGEFLDSGRAVALGLVPASTPAVRPTAAQIAEFAAAVIDGLGFPRGVLRERIGITPACGLAGASPDWARAAVGLAQRAADAIADDPDAI